MLTLGGAGAALGATLAGAGALTFRWYHREPGSAFQHLSENEAELLRAIAGVVWPATSRCPLSGADAELDHFFDAILGTWPAATRDLIRVLINALDDLCTLEHGAGLRALDEQARSAAFMAWVDSDLLELRSAVQSLVVLLGQGWSTHPDVGGIVPSLYKCGYGR